ncbi:MAG TPA: M28 family peptidase [Gemmatimonadaceae bacterium]|nr:M28 family peptidase [Gemmatimonadaceae bacterium]
MLRSLGFQVSEDPFEYSAIPGRLGTPLCGAAAIFMIAVAGHLGWRGHASGALLVLAVGGAIVLGSAWWLARFGVLGLPWWRERGVNLAARRRAAGAPEGGAEPEVEAGTVLGAGAEPDVWLVAHLDSKSQPLPIAIRALGIMASLAIWVISVVVSVLQSGGAPLSGLWPALAVAGVLAGIPVAASAVGSRSPGALDNASGVCTVLLAVEELPSDRSVGVLLTSGEELGLAGARAWARAWARKSGRGWARAGLGDGAHAGGVERIEGAAGATAINVDSVDDAGAVRVIYPRARPAALLRALTLAAGELGVQISAGPLPPGLLVDSVALADRGWKVVSLSKGEWQTVARIHTPRDDLASLRGDGVVQVAALVRRTIAELR